MPSSRITVDGTGQVYSGVIFRPLSPLWERVRVRGNSTLDIPFWVGSSGGIFRGLGASAHTVSDSLGAMDALTLLLQRLYTVKYIISYVRKATVCIEKVYTIYREGMGVYNFSQVCERKLDSLL